MKFGSVKITVPEKAERGNKEINTLTKGGNPTQRLKEQSVKLVAGDVDKPVISSVEPKAVPKTKKEEAKEKAKPKVVGIQKKDLIFKDDVSVLGDDSIKIKRHRVPDSVKERVRDEADELSFFYKSMGDKIELRGNIVREIVNNFRGRTVGKQREYLRELQILINRAVAGKISSKSELESDYNKLIRSLEKERILKVVPNQILKN